MKNTCLKKTVALIAVFAMMCSFVCTAYASGFDEVYGKDYNEIMVIYNGEVLTFGDVMPEEINDRVMLPFRALLEGMGATVEYDGALNSVTAVRGDTAVEFTVGGDTFYVDKNGEKSEIKSDVPTVEINDRVLVPVRFVSNALGMKVGWEDFYSTVYIVDVDSYLKELEENTPNMSKLFETAPETDKYNTSADTITLDLNVFGDDASAKIEVTTNKADGVIGMSGTISWDLQAVSEYIPDVKDSKFEAILDGEMLYFKTDLVKQITANSAEVDLAAYLIDDKWFKIDLKELVNMIFGDEEMTAQFENMIGMIKGSPKKDKTEVFKAVLDNYMLNFETLPEYFAYAADQTVKAYIALDKYIAVTDNGVSIKFDEGFLSDIFGEAISDFLPEIDFDFNMSYNYGENEGTAEGKMTFGYKPDMGKLEATLGISESAKKDNSAAAPKIPENAEDLIKLLGEY